MGLTWEEYLQLADVIKNLNDSIYKNRNVVAAAKAYEEFFDDVRFMQFMAKIRLTLKKFKNFSSFTQF